MKMNDNITTDHIMPSNAKLLPFRSNIPHLANYCLTPVDETFPQRAGEAGAVSLLQGHNYGQGSSRNMLPWFLCILRSRRDCESFARIHRSNLINSGIMALTF